MASLVAVQFVINSLTVGPFGGHFLFGQSCCHQLFQQQESGAVTAIRDERSCWIIHCRYSPSKVSGCVLALMRFLSNTSWGSRFLFSTRKTRRGWYKLCALKNECLKTERKNMKQSTRRTLFLSLIIGLALLAGCEDQESTTRDDDINSHTGGVQQSSPDTGYTEPSVPPQSPPYQREPSQPGGDSDPFPRQPPEVDTVTPGEDKQ